MDSEDRKLNIYDITGIIIVAVILLLIAVPAFSADYYVSTSGHNNNPGTEALPFATIQKGADEAFAGDNVFIFAGAYVENVVVNNSGTDYDYMISFLPYGDGEVIVDAVIGLGLYIPRGSDYIRISGLTFINGHEAFGNGAGIRAMGNHGIFSNNVFHDNKHGIMISGWTEEIGQPFINNQYNEVAYNIAYDNEASGIWVKHGDYTYIHHNLVYHNSTLWSEKGAITYYCGDGNEAYNNTVFANHERGIHIYNGTNPCPAPNSKIYNNIVVVTEPTDEVFSVDELIVIDPTGEFHHNLWYSQTGSPLFAWGYDESHQGGITFGFSDYLETATALNALNGNGDMVGDPLLNDPDNLDFDLTWGSPAIDAGINDPALYDPDGTRPDLGRFYYDQSGSGEIVITIAPVGEPIVVPSNGGSFSYEVTLENNSEESLTFEAWVDVTLPVGGHFGPLVTPRSVTLLPSATLTRTLSQSVPGSASEGEYTLNVYAGESSNGMFYGSNRFDFTKESTSVVDAKQVSHWQSDGCIETVSEIGDNDKVLSVPNLHRAYPNPFNPETTITFTLPHTVPVSLKIYDISGREVENLVDGVRNAGRYDIRFNGTGLPSGLYIYRLKAGETVNEGKMMMIK
jgi:hypothetical protein